MSKTVRKLPESLAVRLKTVGKSISIARRRRKIKITDFAARCGFSRGLVQRIEKGDPGVSVGSICIALYELGMDASIMGIANPLEDKEVGILPLDEISSRVSSGSNSSLPSKGYNSLEQWSIAFSKRTKLCEIYLQELWWAQEGRCFLCGATLDYTATGLTAPSIDRIDSMKGYEQGNVQIVLLGMNFLKNAAPQEEAIELLTSIRGCCL